MVCSYICNMDGKSVPMAPAILPHGSKLLISKLGSCLPLVGPLVMQANVKIYSPAILIPDMSFDGCSILGIC